MSNLIGFREELLTLEPVVVTKGKKSRSSNNNCRPKRGQANKRERVRTENVNAGFDNLRKLIPTDPEDRKLSKIEVLRLATSYINHLYNLTRANSCLEAETMDLGHSTNNSLVEDPNRKSNLSYIVEGAKTVKLQSGNQSNRKHICTFCLMMTKTATPLNVTKRK